MHPSTSPTGKPTITSPNPDVTSEKQKPCCNSQKALIITALFILTVAAAAITFAVTASVAYALLAAAVTVLVFSTVAALACKSLFCSSREATARPLTKPPLITKPPVRERAKKTNFPLREQAASQRLIWSILPSLTKEEIEGFTGKDLKRLILTTLKAKDETYHVSHCKLIIGNNVEILDETPLRSYSVSVSAFEALQRAGFRTLAPLPEILDDEFQEALKSADFYCDETYMNEGGSKDWAEGLAENAGKARTVLERNMEKLQTMLKETTEDSEAADKAVDNARNKVTEKKLDELRARREKANNHKTGIADVIRVVEYQLARLPK